MEPDGRLLFTGLIRRYRLSTLFTGAEMFDALRRFLLYKQRIVAMRADARYWFEIDNELAFRIAIARMEGIAITRAALHQLTTLALRAGNCRFIWFINLFRMFTFRIAAASNKHPEPPLPQRQFAATEWTKLSLQNFDDMSVRLAFQGTDIITFRIV